MVARMMPGVANTILMLCACRKSLAQPILPKTRIKTRPAITGEIANGMSIRVVRICFPRKRNFVIAQEEKRPNTVLNSTAETVATSVS